MEWHTYWVSLYGAPAQERFTRGVWYRQASQEAKCFASCGLAASYNSNARHPLHRFRLKRRACLFGSFAFPDDLSISNSLAVGLRLLLFSMIYIVITLDVKAFGTAQVRTVFKP